MSYDIVYVALKDANDFSSDVKVTLDMWFIKLVRWCEAWNEPTKIKRVPCGVSWEKGVF